MKTFFNVLYRRILYKIPLKLLLVILAVFAICFACFSNAGLVTNEYTKTIYRNQNNYIKFSDYGNPMYLCMSNVNNCGGSWGVHQTADISTSSLTNIVNTNNNNITPLVCISQGYYFNIIPNSSSCNIKVIGLTATEYTKAQCKSTYGLIEDSECVGMDSMTCQTTYNLIPINSVDQNYCTTNNLCPSCSTCPVCPTNTGLSLTELYINNILHVGAPTILMNIPEEINREYAYTQGGNVMNIDVFGYNVDYEKMQGVIDTQSYIPTEEDFNNIIAILGPYSKIIIFFVFLFIVWAWIKKPFKSKKL